MDNPTEVFAKIDALSTHDDVPKAFIADVQAILSALAYHALMSDASAAHEEWHDDFTKKLVGESDKKSRTAQLGLSRSLSSAASGQLRGKPAKRVDASSSEHNGTRAASSDTAKLPPSLRAILAGTHPSLKES
ncbi:MAG: hypothetical protein KGL39_23975 [Patescibacteria group bacterium]|nr:hypothetical protein [Patescibacteria group bacterium]